MPRRCPLTLRRRRDVTSHAFANAPDSDMTGLNDLLKSMLPLDVAFAAGAIADGGVDLFDVERSAVSGAVAKRQRNSVPAGSTLEPRWRPWRARPRPFRRPQIDGRYGRGALLDRSATAIIYAPPSLAGARHIWALVSISTTTRRLKNGLRDIICRPDERRMVAETGLSADGAKLLFVVKEAVFKAYYPATSAFLDFHEVSVELDERNRSFKATLVAAEKPRLADSRCFQGRVGRVQGHLIAVVAVARQAPAP